MLDRRAPHLDMQAGDIVRNLLAAALSSSSARSIGTRLFDFDQEHSLGLSKTDRFAVRDLVAEVLDVLPHSDFCDA